MPETPARNNPTGPSRGRSPSPGKYRNVSVRKGTDFATGTKKLEEQMVALAEELKCRKREAAKRVERERREREAAEAAEREWVAREAREAAERAKREAEAEAAARRAAKGKDVDCPAQGSGSGPRGRICDLCAEKGETCTCKACVRRKSACKIDGKAVSGRKPRGDAIIKGLHAQIAFSLGSRHHSQVAHKV